MDERKHNQSPPWDEGIYGTGRTQPRKNHGSIIALLLILVIFLSGVVVFLSLMNVRLLSQLSDQPTPQQNGIVFSRNADPNAGMNPMSADPDPSGPAAAVYTSELLGITVEEVSSFYQHFYRLPPGLMITAVEPDSAAAIQGLDVGDVVTHLNGSPITDAKKLAELLDGLHPGAQIPITLCRAGEELSLNLTISD